MKTKTITVAAVLLLWCSLAWPQKTTKTIVLIDASGSMAGFFNTEAMDSLRMQITDSLPQNSAEVRSFAYDGVDDPTGLQPYQKHPADFGNVTLLDRAYDEARKTFPGAGMMLMVTDNIQDPDEKASDKEANESIKKFYAKIQGQEVVQGVFFIAVLDFEGPLYRRDGKTKLADYNGKRALIVYALLFDKGPDAGKNLNGMLARLSSPLKRNVVPFRLDAHEALRMSKPIVVDSNQQEPGVHFLTLKKGVLVNDGAPLSEGEPIIGKFKVSFKFNLPNLQIPAPRALPSRIKQKFSLADTNDCSSFAADTDTIIPEIKEVPAKITSPAGTMINKEYEATVTVKFKRGVRFQISPSAFFCYLFKRDTGKFTGEIPLRLGLERREVFLSQEILARFRAPDSLYFEKAEEQYQTKILGLDLMFKQILRDTVLFEKTYPAEFRVQYPIWPAFVLLGMLALLAFAGYRWYDRQPQFELIPGSNGILTFNKIDLAEFDTDSDDAIKRMKQMFTLYPFFDFEPIRLNRRVAAEMRRIPFWGVVVKARRGYQLVPIENGLAQEPTTSLRLQGEWDQFKIRDANE